MAKILIVDELVHTTHRVPVMLVSALKKEAEAILRGAAGYIQKPITAGELRAAVDRVLGGVSDVTILVVDDDPDIRLCYQMVLEPPFRVLEAQDGREALDVLAAERVALAVVDGGQERLHDLAPRPD